MTDWESRYQSGDMPWEKGEPSPGLVDFLNAHADLEPGSILVPGCGTGHDVRSWAQAGFAAIGCDLAPSAVRIARERNGGCFAKYVLGDFLSDPPFEHFDWIFEHTLFCAIDPHRREDYVKAVVRWLKPDGNFLAVHYLIPDTDGPPFGATRDELMELFSPHFDLLEEWVPRSYPNRTGLELMLWWRKKNLAESEERARPRAQRAAKYEPGYEFSWALRRRDVAVAGTATLRTEHPCPA